MTTSARWTVVGGSALTLLVLATSDSVGKPFERATNEQKPLGEYSKYGDYAGQLVPNVLYAGGMLAAHYGGSPLAFYRAEMMFTATVYAAVISTVMKHTIREPRPNSAARDSFPSGHATTAFAFAGIVAMEHGWFYGVPAMALATFVSYSRINDEKHRLHDVVAGATIGLGCAFGIYYAHQDERETALNFQILPSPMEDGAEVNVVWTL